MELFERIRYLSETKGYSLAKIARHIGITPQAFNKWLDSKSQRNLWEHLEKILSIFPDVRPEWLYRDILPAFHDGTGPTAQTNPEVEALKKNLVQKEAELDEERALNRKLTARLLTVTGGASEDTGDVAKAAGHE